MATDDLVTKIKKNVQRRANCHHSMQLQSELLLPLKIALQNLASITADIDKNLNDELPNESEKEASASESLEFYCKIFLYE